MAKIVPLHKYSDPVSILKEHLVMAKAGKISSMIIITKNNLDEFMCQSITGTSALERAGMCAWAEQVMLNSMEEI